jgi:hypothetical protein
VESAALDLIEVLQDVDNAVALVCRQAREVDDEIAIR